MPYFIYFLILKITSWKIESCAVVSSILARRYSVSVFDDDDVYKRNILENWKVWSISISSAPRIRWSPSADMHSMRSTDNALNQPMENKLRTKWSRCITYYIVNLHMMLTTIRRTYDWSYCTALQFEHLNREEERIHIGFVPGCHNEMECGIYLLQ